MTYLKSTTIIGVVLLGAACGGGTQVPAQDFARSEASIRAASQAGAANNPAAAAHLNIAKQTMGRAQKADEKGDGESAKALLNDAKADADLSLVLTHATEAEARAQQSQRRLESVK